CVRDGHSVDHGLRLVGIHAQSVDGIGCESHRSGDGLRSGVQSGRITQVVPGKLGDNDGNSQAQRALDGRKDGLRQTVFGDATHELRADGVADGEQEHEKRKRLERLRNGDSDLPDENAREQRGCDCPQADTLECELSKIISEAERQKNGYFRIASQRVEQPVENRARHNESGLSLPPSLAAATDAYRRPAKTSLTADRSCDEISILSK